MPERPAWKQKRWWLLAGGVAAVAATALTLDGETLAGFGRLLHDLQTGGEELRARILAHGKLAPLLFIGLQALQVIMGPVPGEATGTLGGYLFGVWPSLVYSTIGLALGSWIAFAFARLFRRFINNRLAETRAYQQFNHLVEKGDFAIPFILFLLPGMPKDMLCYVLGASEMPAGLFLFLSAVGRIPGTLLLSLAGAKVYEGNFRELALLFLCAVVFSVPCYMSRHALVRWLKQRKAAKALEARHAGKP